MIFMEILIVKLLKKMIAQIIIGIMVSQGIIGVLIISTNTQMLQMMEKIGTFLIRLVRMEVD